MNTQLGTAYFDLLIESLSGEIYIIREDYTIEYANHLFTKRFKGASATGKCYKIIYNLDKPCDWCQCKNLTKKQFTTIYENFNTVDNRWDEITTTKIHRNNNKITYLLVIKDISKRKKLEDELHYKLDEKSKEINYLITHSKVFNENLEIIVEGKTKSLKTIIKELKFKEYELLQQNEELIAKEQDMNEQNEELIAKEQNVNEQNEELIAQDQEINQQNDKLLSQDQEINQQKEELLSQEQEITQQKEELLSQEQEIIQQKNTLLSQEQEIIQQSKELLFKDEESISKDQEIDQQKIKALSRDDELMKRKKQLLSKELKLKQQKEKLLFNEHELMKQKKELISKELEITSKCKELEILNIRLIKADINKNCFLSFMSHELRTPLNAVLGFSQSLELQYFGELNEKQLEYVKLIHNSGEHLLSLINSILDIAKIDAGSMDFIIEEVDISLLVQELLAIMKPLFEKKQVTTNLYIDDQIGLIEADKVKCKQILLNILDNAIKYSPEGGNITIRIEKFFEEKVKISISDTGIGIKEEEKESIFLEFYQSKHTKDLSIEGTGLGLALSKRLVDLHNGEIGVISKENKGSTFWFTLPIKRVDSTIL